ncbi:hypothetical protein L3Q82_023635, partial [Scortum barcoo]
HLETPERTRKRRAVALVTHANGASLLAMGSFMENVFPAGDESDASTDEWDLGCPDKKAPGVQNLDAVEPHADDNVSMLKRAISKGDIETVEKLLDNGEYLLHFFSSRMQQVFHPSSPTLQCSSGGCSNPIQDTGMDVETRLGFEWTPLMCAVNVANYNLTELLLDRGASANFSKDRCTVLMASCTASASEDRIARCVELLLSRNADPNMVDRCQMTCLMLAARDGYSKVINLLVSHGAEINIQDSNGYTALSIAVQYGREEAVLKLLQLGADKTIRTTAGKSPADLAVIFKHSQISRILASSSHISSVQAFSSTEETLSKFFKTNSEPPPSQESVTKLDDLELLLHGLDLGYLTDIMTENDITWSYLLTMDKEDLQKIGITDPVDQEKVLSAVQQMHLDKVDLDTISQLGETYSGSEDLHNFLISVRQQCCYLTETIQDVISRFPRKASQLVFSLDPKKEAQAVCNQLVVQTKDLQKEVTCLRNLLCQTMRQRDGGGLMGRRGWAVGGGQKESEERTQVGGVREFKWGEKKMGGGGEGGGLAADGGVWTRPEMAVGFLDQVPTTMGGWGPSAESLWARSEPPSSSSSAEPPEFTCRCTWGTLGSQVMCDNIPGLMNKQRQLCRQHPKVMQAIGAGMKDWISECQHQFRNHRWNCNTTARDHNLFGRLLLRSSREVAFMYAISSAGVVYTLARACSQGELDSCSCDPTKKGSWRDGKGSFNWGGCSDHVDYAISFSQTFVDAKERKERDARALMNLHNNRAGRKAVKRFMTLECKCHGVSGSCSVRTCWLAMADFRRTGDHLRKRYNGAVQVATSTSTAPGSPPRTHTSNDPARTTWCTLRTRQTTAYGTTSQVDFPETSRGTSAGSMGTGGRLCNRTSRGTDGCEVMCAAAERLRHVVAGQPDHQVRVQVPLVLRRALPRLPPAGGRAHLQGPDVTPPPAKASPPSCQDALTSSSSMLHPLF